MVGKDIIIMSKKEFRRVPVISNVITGRITQAEAGSILNLSNRHIRRLVKAVRVTGDIALIHQSRGKPSHASKSQELKDKALKLCKTTYQGFGPTLASEKLLELDKLYLHPETLRLWFIESGIPYKKRKISKHRSWRPRKESFGQMVQMDGSHHSWLGSRADRCVLMGYIDDATGRIFGHFYKYEGTMPAIIII